MTSPQAVQGSGGRRIAVVARDPSEMETIRRWLVAAGHEVESGPSGGAVDLVVLDTRRAGDSEAIRAVRPGAPILLVGVSGDPEGILRSIEAGALDWIPGPLDRDRLLAWIADPGRAAHGDERERMARFLRAALEVASGASPERCDCALLSGLSEIVWFAEPSPEDPSRLVLACMSDRIRLVTGIEGAAFRRDPGLLESLVHPEDREGWALSARRVIETRTPETRTYRIRVNGTEEYRWLEECLRPDLGAGGSVRGIYGVATDATERMRLGQALRERDDLFRSAFESAGVGMALLSKEGRVLRVNASLSRMLATAEEDLAGRRLSELNDPEDAGAAGEAIDRLVSGEDRSCEFVARYARRSGGWVWASVDAALVRGDGDSSVAVIAQIRDLTVERELEEQLRRSQKMEAIGRLAGGIAHDFNNLLTAILGYSEGLLPEFAPGDPRREDLEEIRRAGQRAASLTRQLLAFSRRQVHAPERLDLSEVAAGTEKMLRRVLGEDVELATAFGRDLPPIHADPGLIEQVILNLVVNARDAMPRGGRLDLSTAAVRLDQEEVQGGRTLGPGNYVELVVRDTGSGMDAATQARCFEPFFTTKEVGQGSGLGLSTVYGIVEESRGWISVESEVGVGTEFRVLFPAADRESGPARAQADDRGHERILIVEDEPSVRRLARRVLAEAGYRVEEAADGREALRMRERGGPPFDLIVSDVVMPGLSGPETVDRLRALWPPFGVLYLSGHTDRAIVHHALLERGVEFLQKPFTPEILRRKVRAVLDVHAACPAPDPPLQSGENPGGTP